MQPLKNFVSRNAPVFFLGLIILVVFVGIILSSPKADNNVPAGFKRIEEEVFNGGEPTEPKPELPPTKYAPQIPSPENKGKPYFYGEYDPNLRDAQGYPAPPKVGTATLPIGADTETKAEIALVEQENYAARTKTIHIDFTNNGFIPADAVAFTGQKIVWTNKTANSIKILQALPTHEALKNGIDINPGMSYEFRPLVDKQFTYIEKNNLKYGSLLIADVTQPLMRLE